VQLRLTDVCPNSRVFRADGERLRLAIEDSWARDGVCEVDFENIRIASLSFLDEGIAVLTKRMPVDELRSRLHIVNMTDPDRRLLDEQIAARAARGEGGRSLGSDDQ